LAYEGAATLLLPPHGCSQALPFVPLSGALWRLATYATVWTSVPHGYASFLPQALLPFANAQRNISKISIRFEKERLLKRKSKKYSKLVGWHNPTL
jgi:hypothetical protein